MRLSIASTRTSTLRGENCRLWGYLRKIRLPCAIAPIQACWSLPSAKKRRRRYSNKVLLSEIVRRPSLRWHARIKHLPLSDGNWSYSRPACKDDPAQGWKLHVSATILSAAEVFSRAESILHKNDALFKVPCRLEFLKSLNSGLTDFSQIGKFLTVYPRSADEASKLARELHRATRGLPGPGIPFEAPYRPKSLVHYRYGAFRRSADGTPGFIHAPGGKRYRDRRAPGRAVPTWLEDPFQKKRVQRTRSGAA